MDNSIDEWIRKAQKSGLSENQIYKHLSQQGWKDKQIYDLISNNTPEAIEKQTSSQSRPLKEGRFWDSFWIKKRSVIFLTVIYVLFNLSQPTLNFFSVLTPVRFDDGFLGRPVNFVISIILLFSAFYLFSKWYTKLIGYIVGAGILSGWVLLFIEGSQQFQDFSGLFVIYYYAISALIFFPLIFAAEKGFNKLLKWKWGIYVVIAIILIFGVNTAIAQNNYYQSKYEYSNKEQVIENAFNTGDKDKIFSNCDDLKDDRVRNECLIEYATEFKDPEACLVSSGVNGATSGKYLLANIYKCLVSSNNHLTTEELCGYFLDDSYISCILEYAPEKKNIEACDLIGEDAPLPHYDDWIAFNLVNHSQNNYIETAKDQCIMNILFADRNYSELVESDLSLCDQFNDSQACRFWIYKWLASKNHEEKWCYTMQEEGLLTEDMLYGCTKDIKSYYTDMATKTLDDSWCEKVFVLNKLDGCDVTDCSHDQSHCATYIMNGLSEKAEETGSAEYCDQVRELDAKYRNEPYDDWWYQNDKNIVKCQELGL